MAGDDLVKTLENLGLNDNGEGGDDGNILPIMQSIMQNLLSKEVLYPSLKEITEKVRCLLHLHNCLNDCPTVLVPVKLVKCLLLIKHLLSENLATHSI